MTREETWNRLQELGAVHGPAPSGKWKLDGLKLVGAALKKAYLVDVDLCKADLRGSDLYKAYMRNVDLTEANLSRSSLARADLYEANLSYANLAMTSFIESDLSKANLEGSNMQWADAYAADFYGANLSKADLTNTNFHSASLKQSLIRNASITQTNLSFCNLTGSDITGSLFRDVIQTGWIIKDIKAEYLYNSSALANQEDLESHKVVYLPGQFEELYRCMPYVEMFFETPMFQDDFLTLTSIVENVNTNHMELLLKIKSLEIHGDKVVMKISTFKDDFLYRASALLTTSIQSAMRGCLKSSAYISGINPQDTVYDIPTPEARCHAASEQTLAESGKERWISAIS